ncbi:MAG: phytanoyl-CoA dioxygenase family protein [Verrucomicrobia bacterium]|nr:phytanoyl-CoA dioxygenase family protein [Verrucomicrobiota bacterium]
MLKEVLLRLLFLSNRRVYFSTTIHETSKEGMEPKEDVVRYRSRYTLAEILGVVKEILILDPNLSFHYFFLTDPLGKFWINAVFEKQDIVKMIQDDGVILYKQFASLEQINSVLSEIDFLKTNPPKAGTILRYDTESGFDRVENILPYCSEGLKGLLDNIKVQNIVSMLMEEEAVLLKDKINYKLPGSGLFVPHQDAAAGWERYGSNQLTFALSFDEAKVENGALYFACGAHKKGLLSPLKTPLSAEVVNSLHWDVVLMQPGDALFFDAFVPHFSKPNNSDKPRRMAFLTYNYKKFGDLRETFFLEKRKRQPPIDERLSSVKMIRDQFGKLVYE